MDFLEFLFVPTILFLVVVMPVWLVMHYRSASRSSRALSGEERETLEGMLVTLDRLTERIESLESILDADHPNWRQRRASRESRQANEGDEGD